MADPIGESKGAALRLDFDRLTIRWCVLVAGLVAEGLVLTVGFESPAASARDHWWVRLAAISPELIRIAAASVAAFVVLLAPRLKATLEYARQRAADHRWQPWLLLHLLAFAALYGFLAVVTRGDGSTAGQITSGGLAFCEALAIVTLFFWFLALAPLHYWRVLLARERLTLLAAIAAATTAWLDGEIAQTYWRPLASGTMFLAEHLLRLLYPNVIADPARLLLGTPTFIVRIAPQCSGYEGVGLVTVFLAIYLWLFRSRIRFPHAFLLFPVAAVGVWLANVLRVAGLVAIGSSYSPALAEGGFHSQAGWISFIALALGVIAVTHRMRFFTTVRQDGAGEEINPTAAALLVPFLVLMASMMVTAALSSGFDRLYPLRVLAAVAALLWFRRVYARWDWGWSWPSVCIGGVVFILWTAVDRITMGDNATLGAGIAALGQTEAVVWVGFRVVGSALVIPLVEEMAFRGYLLRRLAAVDLEGTEASRFNWVGFLLSSAAFGLLHGRWLAGTVAGMAYALAFYRRGKLGDAVIAHMTTNGFTALFVLITGAWSLWS
jgi:exosortase E/protease (VPEID-CTERM system)